MAQATSGIELIRQFIATSPFVGHLGMRVDELAADHAVLTLPFSEQVVTIGQVVHGGAIASLADTAAMAASWATDNIPENLRGTTVALTINYLSAATAEDLRADARVMRRGRNLCYVEVDVTRGSGPVAKALVTYKLG
ncbi:MAG: PaaI family thioesterase [Actinomycetota bacterium]